MGPNAPVASNELVVDPNPYLNPNPNPDQVTSNERASKDRFGLWTRKRNYAARKLQLSVRKKHDLHPQPRTPLRTAAPTRAHTHTPAHPLEQVRKKHGFFTYREKGQRRWSARMLQRWMRRVFGWLRCPPCAWEGYAAHYGEEWLANWRDAPPELLRALREARVEGGEGGGEEGGYATDGSDAGSDGERPRWREPREPRRRYKTQP
mgnify:CR=1 FL=1